MNQLAEKPFVLLGVHGFDYEPKKLKQVMDKEKLNWRSWSSRGTAAKWSVRGTPTYYVIDHRGVIRYKWVGYPGAKAIDTTLKDLLKELEASAKNAPCTEPVSARASFFPGRFGCATTSNLKSILRRRGACPSAGACCFRTRRKLMATNYGFHPDALFEYAEASNYYLREASPRVANAFILSVESAAAALVACPTRWRAFEQPEIRRYVFSRFPFVICYRWEHSTNASPSMLSCTVTASPVTGTVASNEARNRALPACG